MIRLDSIGVVRGGRALLRDVSLALAPGTVTALIGPNGAGKSTLLRVMSGETPPTSGRATLDDEALAAIGGRRLAARRATLAQATDAVPGFTVAELAALGPALLADPPSPREIAAIAAEVLTRVGLDALADRPLATLSGGERQRAHLARVLAQLNAGGRSQGPGLLLLDEPIAAQDLAHQHRIMAIAAGHAARGGTVCMVLHDLNWAACVAHRLVALKRGRVRADGPPRAVLTAAMLAEVFDIDLTPGAIPPDRLFVLPRTGSAAHGVGEQEETACTSR